MGDLAKKISAFTNLHQHIQEWIGRQCVIENKARLLIATALRKNHYESDMEIIKLIDISFSIAAQEAAQAVGDDWGDAQKNIGLTDKRVLQQLQRRFEGNVKSLAKNNFARVLQLIFRKELDIDAATKCRPLYYLFKIVLGQSGQWSKGKLVAT
jgi:hypothetical protein